MPSGYIAAQHPLEHFPALVVPAVRVVETQGGEANGGHVDQAVGQAFRSEARRTLVDAVVGVLRLLYAASGIRSTAVDRQSRLDEVGPGDPAAGGDLGIRTLLVEM